MGRDRKWNNNRLDDEELYVGTDVGIYFRNKYMKQWECYGANFPNVAITDLEINPHLKIIRAATAGRGVWETGTFCPANQTLTLNDSPNSFYAAQLSISSSSIIAATELISNISVPRVVAYRAPTINLTSGFEVKLGATFNTGVYSCLPNTANLIQPSSPQSSQPVESSSLIDRALKKEAITLNPNPFDNSFNIVLNVSEEQNIDIFIYDISGKLVNTVVKKQRFVSGNYNFTVDATQWARGVYLCTYKIGEKQKSSIKFIKQ